MYCSRCGSDNPANAKFCMNCAAPLDIGPGPVPSQMPAQPPRYGYPPRRREDACFGEPKGEDQCFGQSRLPGIVVFAIIIIFLGVFSLLRWIVEQAYGSAIADATYWGVFALALGVLIIVLWAILRRPRPRA